ncbi:hypothetical protein ACMAZE_13425 [Pseudopelagicola sp. nBUS_20]|uniref:hypothetical protein n=1 Tax=Pseudopelagicola sp. nBUS_20 TaxID=3395317 RepID=UPI003EC0EF33
MLIIIPQIEELYPIIEEYAYVYPSTQNMQHSGKKVALMAQITLPMPKFQQLSVGI